MDSHQYRSDCSSQGRENKPQRKRALGGGGPAPYAIWGNEETEKKPKFHDDATVHKASSMKTWCVKVGVEELECPAQSPDLNPTEHLWDELEHRLNPRPPHQHQCLISLMLLWLNEHKSPQPRSKL
ncbi:hypothetical protein PDJAM_G00030120 [Pangasius djambal]|uniref:Uncharacterized protein n=1 Tax=Pangasius djambal TaxID=1691987 RepID=A0ACC5YQF0_9TELE|nr:hypothetical protein [Pangasius djambal]